MARSRRVSGAGLLQMSDLVRHDRPAKALELERTDLVGVDEIRDRCVDALADQDLAWGGFRAQAMGQVRHAADRRIVLPSFEADRPDGRVALRDPDAQVEIVTTSAPFETQAADALAHGLGHPDRT